MLLIEHMSAVRLCRVKSRRKAGGSDGRTRRHGHCRTRNGRQTWRCESRIVPSPRYVMQLVIKKVMLASPSQYLSPPVTNSTASVAKKIPEKSKPQSEIVINIRPSTPAQHKVQVFKPVAPPDRVQSPHAVPDFVAVPSAAPFRSPWDARAYQKQRSLMRLMKKKYVMEAVPPGYRLVMPKEAGESYLQVPQQGAVVAMPQEERENFIEIPQGSPGIIEEAPAQGATFMQSPRNTFASFQPFPQQRAFLQIPADRLMQERSWGALQDQDASRRAGFYGERRGVWKSIVPEVRPIWSTERRMEGAGGFVRGASQAAVLAELLNRAVGR